jgi:hypothetical protein
MNSLDAKETQLRQIEAEMRQLENLARHYNDVKNKASLVHMYMCEFICAYIYVHTYMCIHMYRSTVRAI